MELELQPLLPGLDPDHVDDLREEGPGLVGDADDLHLPGFDLGDIQDVVDEGEQELARPLDVPGALGHALRDVLPQNELVEADDGVDGRTDLVAHAGEEVVLRPVELLDLLLLLLGEGVLLLVHPVEEHEQDAGQKPHHDNGEGGVEEGALQGVPHRCLGEEEGGGVADQGLRRAQDEKYPHAPPLQGDADVDKAEDEPLRNAAVEAPGGEKADGEQHQHQDRDRRGPHVDAPLPDTVFDGGPHDHKAHCQDEDIPDAPAHGQNKQQSEHADTRHQAEHPLPQADPVVCNDL